MSDGKNEPISAKLRRWADPDKSGATMNCFASGELGINCGEMICDECEREVFRRIASEVDCEIESVKASYARSLHPMFGVAVVRAIAEGVGAGCFAWLKEAIDRYYLPRPLFEDGEPVQDSDLEEIGLCYLLRVHGRKLEIRSRQIRERRKPKALG